MHSHNNGNVQSITNNRDWHRSQSFTYDSLNRIASAQTNSDNVPAFQGGWLTRGEEPSKEA